jgi:hypothetical protein
LHALDWETVPGQFGGYLTSVAQSLGPGVWLGRAGPLMPGREGSALLRPSNAEWLYLYLGVRREHDSTVPRWIGARAFAAALA